MRVEVFTKPNCPKCDATKRWLAANRVKHVVRSAVDYRDFLVLDLRHRQAPVIIVTREDGALVDHWSGHDTAKLAQHFGGVS